MQTRRQDASGCIELLERQHYRLAWWRCANDEINWRRFFDINELAAMRVEDDEVFEAMHATLFRLYAEGLVDGVRVDHIDGLSLPENYCRQLRARLSALEKQRPSGCPAGPAYFVVEKILTHDERLPAEWQTDGTTGYDFHGRDQRAAARQHGRTAAERACGNASAAARETLPPKKTLRAGDILQRSFASQLEATLEYIVQPSPRATPIPARHFALCASAAA